MPVVFSDLAQTCAPFVASEALAGVVSPESRFALFTIRINSRAPLGRQPATKADAIEVAASSEATCHDIHIGPDGVGPEELRRLNLSIIAAFARCLNLNAPATPFDGYCCLSVKVGADSPRAEQVLQSCYGRDDPSVGGVVNYGDQVRREIERFGPTVARFTIGDTGKGLQTNVSANSSKQTSLPKWWRKTLRGKHTRSRRRPRGTSSRPEAVHPSWCFKTINWNWSRVNDN